MTRVAVLGAGSWGTAFAAVLCDAGCETTLWARRPELAAEVTATGVNSDYLPGVCLPAGLRVTADVGRALEGAEVAVLALPSQHVRSHLTGWLARLPEDALLVSLCKGVELGTAKRMSEVIREVTGVPAERVAVVTGPNLAHEIAARQPAATVVACSDPQVAAFLQGICRTAYFRPYTNTDVVGCELGGVVKNVIALACGIAVGMGYGTNTLASIMTRGLAETARLGGALGAEPATFAGLAGLGDLVATCTSSLSRNRTVGERLGRGMSVEEAVRSTRQTAEGVRSCRAVLDLADAHGVDMPITAHVVDVVYAGMPPEAVVASLMSREARAE